MTYGYHTKGETVASDLSAEIKGKVVLTTGASPGGLGASFVKIIAGHEPKLLILAGRSRAKLEQTADEIAGVAPGVATRLLEMDLASQASVRAAAGQVRAYAEPVDVLVLNAGVMACPYRTTPDGVESQFGANHIGHFLFTNLVMDRLLASPHGGRVVSVSSNGFRLSPIRFQDLGFDGGKTYNPWVAYGQSKTANMLFALSLAKKLGDKGLVAVSLHPGAILTNLGRDVEEIGGFASLTAIDRQMGNAAGWVSWDTFDFKTLSTGVSTHVRAAFDPKLKESNGRYLDDAEVEPLERVRAWARDPIEAEMLWKISEEIVGEKFSY